MSWSYGDSGGVEGGSISSRGSEPHLVLNPGFITH